VRIIRADLERVIEQGYTRSPAGSDEANQAQAFWDGEEQALEEHWNESHDKG
jgi:hypothetical protein